MEDNQSKRDLGVSKLASKSLAVQLAEAKQSKNLLGDIRKQTRGILRVLNTWKLEDVSKLQLKLNSQQERFSKLKNSVSGEKKQKPSPADTFNLRRKPSPDKKRVDDGKKVKPEDKKKLSPEEEARKRRQSQYRDLRKSGASPEEARQKVIRDSRRPQSTRPQVTPPKPTAPSAPGKPNIFSGIKERFGNIKTSIAEGLNLRGITGKSLNLFERFTALNRIKSGDVIGGGAQLLSTLGGKFSKGKTGGFLNYFDSIRQAAQGDYTGAATSAATTKVSSSILGRLINLLPKTSISPNIIAKGATGLRTAGAGLLLDYISDQTLGKALQGQRDKKVQETIEKIQSYSPEKRNEVIKRIQSEIEREKSWQSGAGGTYDNIMNFLMMREKSSSQTALEMREQVLKGLNSKKPPKMAEGGVVTKPTLAIIGEGKEKEYIVPESKVQQFVQSQSSGGSEDAIRKPARTILGVVNNFISQFGTNSGDIRRMVGGDILRMERIFGRESFVLPVFTKGEGAFDKIIGDAFTKLLKLKKVSGGPSQELYDSIGNLLVSIDSLMSEIESTITGGGTGPGGISGPTGPIPEGTNEDFWTLVAVASLESDSPQGQADVAQSVYNRLASGVYSGRTIKALILAENQYQPVREANQRLWSQIKDRESAIAAVESHPRGRGRGISKVDNAARNITNPSLQKNAAEWVGGRTDFAVPSAAQKDPGAVGLQTRNGHLFGWYVGPGAVSYGRRNPGPAPIPSFAGITSPAQQNVGTQNSNSQPTSTGLPTSTNPNIRPTAQPKSNFKGYIIVPGHASGGGAPGEKELVKRLAKTAYDKIKRENPNSPVQFMDLDSRFSDDDAGWEAQKRWYEQMERQGYDVLEIHMDREGGTGRGVIRAHRVQSGPATEFARTYGAYPIDWRSKPGEKPLAGPSRDVDLFELGEMRPGKTYTQKDVQDLSASFAASVISSLNKSPMSAARQQASRTSASTAQPSSGTSVTGLITPARGIRGDGFGFIPSRGRNHYGIDIAGPMGTPVVSPEDGVVTSAGFEEGGFGNIIRIRGARGEHWLAHLSQILTTVGARVKANQVVGKMGSTGRSTGPHLHWEVHINGRAVNPLSLSPADASGNPLAPDTTTSEITPGTTPGYTPASLSPSVQARFNRYRRFLPRAFQNNPRLNTVPRRTQRNISALPPGQGSGTVVAVQPVISQPQPQQSSQSLSISSLFNNSSSQSIFVTVGSTPIVGQVSRSVSTPF